MSGPVHTINGTMCHHGRMTTRESLAPPLDRVLPTAHFTERHHRTVRAPVEDVWAAAQAVTPGEVRLLRPFMALRSLPSLVVRRARQVRPDAAPFLSAFEDEGFVPLHRDPRVLDGRAWLAYGAAGRFWSLLGDAAAPLADAAAFADHAGPGTAKVAFSLEVAAVESGSLVTTETRVVATDEAARRAFGRYWLLIRGPSELIRRSWLAAIDRRARA